MTPTAHDAEVTAVREAARLIAEDERLTPVLVPLGDGLLVAARDWPSRDEDCHSAASDAIREHA